MDIWMIVLLAVFVLASIAFAVYFIHEKKYSWALFTALSLIIIAFVFYFLGVVLE